MKKLIGKVSSEERNEIQWLFERRNGLRELACLVTAENVALYEKLVKDLGISASRFEAWWERMSKKYNWESEEDANWEIDFNTCEIFLSVAD